MDLCFEGQPEDGVTLIDHLSTISPGTFLIVLSGDTEVIRVVSAMRRRLFEFVHKGEGFLEHLTDALTRANELRLRLQEENSVSFLSQSPKVRSVLSTADQIIRSGANVPILVLGESGTGKEFLAQYIAKSLKKRVVVANMAAIPHDTAESILFGHERGAFTGAVSNSIGLIESAHENVFFLDEIGECSLATQAKLLRVLQEKVVQPVGSTKARAVNVQFLAATHQNLDQMVKDGRFRLDLYQRMNAFTLTLPSLRERPEDILFYANLFLNQERGDDRAYSILPDGAQELLKHQWPGNVRELSNFIQRFKVLSHKFILDAESVREYLPAMSPTKRLVPTVGRRVRVADVKRQELLESLSTYNGNRRLAAKSLGVSEATVYRWINEFGIGDLSHGSMFQHEVRA